MARIPTDPYFCTWQSLLCQYNTNLPFKLCFERFWRRCEKQGAVVERRFGLHGREVATLEEIGNELGVTRERVRQIQLEAIKRLRQILEREGFSLDTLFMEE